MTGLDSRARRGRVGRIWTLLAVGAALLAVPAAGQSPGEAVLFAGVGLPGFEGDGGPAASARLNSPGAVGFAADGSVYIADLGNHRIRRVAPDGTITTVAGAPPIDPANGGFSVETGPALEALLSFPFSVEGMPGGGFVFADNGNNRVRVVSAAGQISTLAGTGAFGYNGDDMPANTAALDFPTDALPFGDGVLIADFNNSRVRLVNAAGRISTFAGNGFRSHSGDGELATLASISAPYGLAVDAQGNVYITDFASHTIRRVGTDGVITTIAGQPGQSGFSGDGGPAVSALLFEPAHIAVARDGRIVFSDSGNNRIREIRPDLTIHTVAGTGNEEPLNFSANPLEINLFAPTGVAVSAAGDTFLTDDGNHRVIRIVGAPTPSVMPGDVNRNGQVDVLDAVLALRAVALLGTLEPDQAEAADVAPKPGVGGAPFGDGRVTVLDVVRILRRVAALDTEPTWPG